MNIDQKLKNARKAAGLTQEDLAEKINVSRQTISSWENGRSYPDIVSIILLSDIYNLSLDHLLKGDEDMIKQLEKDTNTVKSNRKLIGIYLACIMGYGILYLMMPMISLPKIENIAMNLLVFLVSGLALLYQLIHHIKRTDFLSKSTSNVVLTQVAIVVFGLLLIVGTFLVLDIFLTKTWQLLTARIITCLTIACFMYAINKKIS
ncbi:helix-turn-helix domain-containing protein [Enterococcus sp. AZ109]|uniref:helix-turn-helix domain-containing protein n=1 Tax=Enterococcus sp. AZ109 TaxID=2774634 RepID=UPI003F28E7E7